MIRLLYFFSFLFPVLLFAQDAKNILKAADKKSQTISNGYYKMRKSMKFIDEADTNSNNTFQFYFQKLDNDSIFPSRFHYQQFYSGQYLRDALYTGEDFVSFSRKDSTAQITSKSRWVKTLMMRRHGELFNFYAPFTGALYSPFPKALDYEDNKATFKFIGQGDVEGFTCFHVRMTKFPKYDSTETMHNIQTTYDYWINIKDRVLVKYAASSLVKKGNDTLTEYFAWSVYHYKLNALEARELSEMQLQSIPSYCHVKEYTETANAELLQRHSTAPIWKLTSLRNEQISLLDYRGKLVLLDFFYISCYPCMQVLPTLKKLHEKYKGRGLEVVGINPFDKEEDGVKKAVQKRGITYTTFLDSKSVAKDYLVSSYPTLYLIDKKGKIIFSSVGYNEQMELVLEKLIKENL